MSGCSRLLPVPIACRGAEPGQIRDKYRSPFVAAQQRSARPAAIDKLPGRRKRGAIYARFSSKYQHSTEQQVQKCLQWAEANGVEVDDAHIFVDEGKSGRSRRRRGYERLQHSIQNREVDVIIVFATSRLSRKTYRALMFVEEEIIDRRLRCVFVSSHVDTDDKERWRTLMQTYAGMDEIVLQITASHVRAAHESQLRAGLVFNTLTYGYTGIPIEGRLTKLGRPLRRLAIDEEAAAWVRKIFVWFVVQDLSISEIVRRLNAEHVPLPVTAHKRRFSYGIVRRILENPRYRGQWPYGETEVVWQNKADYARQFKRDEPLAVAELEHLRILDDPTFAAAQKRLAEYGRRAGRRPKDRDRARLPRLLNDIVRCPKHGATMWVAGSCGSALACHVCRHDVERVLFSTLPRALAQRLVFEKVAELLRLSDDLVGRAVESCRRHAEGLQRPDEGQLQQFKKEEARLTQSLDFIREAPGATDRDRAENHAKMLELQRKRAAVEATIRAIEDSLGKQSKVPTAEQVQDLVRDLAGVLEEATASDDAAAIAAAKRVVIAVTGGEIVLGQMGSKPRKGWLRGTFNGRPLRAIFEALGAPPLTEEAVEVVIDFREPTLVERLAEPVVALLNAGVLQKAIPAKLVEQGLPKVSRSVVASAIRLWHTSRGLQVPDGRASKAVIAARNTEPPLHVRVADAVMDLWHSDVALIAIAQELDVERDVVTAAVRHWHETRGLPVPDGRSRRKALRLKRERRDAA